jgi:hypothetical protein
MRKTAVILLLILALAFASELQARKGGKGGKTGKGGKGKGKSESNPESVAECEIGPGSAIESTVAGVSPATVVFREESLFACYSPGAIGGDIYCVNGADHLGPQQGTAYDYVFNAEDNTITATPTPGADLEGAEDDDDCTYGTQGVYQITWNDDCTGGSMSILDDDCVNRQQFATAFATFTVVEDFDPTCPFVPVVPASSNSCPPLQQQLAAKAAQAESGASTEQKSSSPVFVATMASVLGFGIALAGVAVHKKVTARKYDLLH